jgi:uncharacterized protein YdeI (YjbR/CyaY-like superfamily)
LFHLADYCQRWMQHGPAPDFLLRIGALLDRIGAMDLTRAKTKDPDEWLENAPAFTKAMAVELRDWIFRTAPDLTESIKWNALCFSGRKLVCALGPYQRHLAVVFFRGTELADPAGLFDEQSAGNANTRGIRLTSLAGLNRRALTAMLLAAMELDAQDRPCAPKVKRPPMEMPDFFRAALKKNKKAAGYYESLAPTYQREYLVWVTTAKREETREKRLEEPIKALAAGCKWMDRKKA